MIQRTLGRAVALATGLVLIGGVASAAIPAADGTIRGCYSTSGGLLAPPKGSLRVVDEGENCRSTERALPWNQIGPQGPKGDTGAKGDTGPAGEQGPPGEPGSTGDSVFFTQGDGYIVRNVRFRLAKTVPAGSYVVEAQITGINTAGRGPKGIGCFLLRGGESPNHETSFHKTFYLHDANDDFSEGSMLFKAAFDHPGGEIAIECPPYVDDHPTNIDAHLMATRVASVG